MKRSVVILSILVLALLLAAPVGALQPAEVTTVFPSESPWVVPWFWIPCDGFLVNMTWAGIQKTTYYWPHPYVDDTHWQRMVVQTKMDVVVFNSTDPSKSLSSNMDVRGEYRFDTYVLDPEQPWLGNSRQVVMEGTGLHVMVPGYGIVHMTGQFSWTDTKGEYKFAGHPDLSLEDGQALCDCLK